MAAERLESWARALAREATRSVWLAVWAAPERPLRLGRPRSRPARRSLRVLFVLVVVLLAYSASRQLTSMVHPAVVLPDAYVLYSPRSREPMALGDALAAMQVCPLLLAATRPVMAWRISALGLMLAPHLGGSWPWSGAACLAYAMMLLLVGYSYGAYLSLGVGVVTVVAVIAPPTVPHNTSSALIAAVATVVLLVVGDNLRSRRDVERRLVATEQLRQHDLARQAVLRERSRIARELHDVVAHHMSMIAIQSEAALLRADELPRETSRALTAIRGASTTALTEMRRMIGLLRDQTDAVEREPLPGLERIPEMVEAARAAGLRVDVTMITTSTPLPASLDVSAYRIVQEALSNAGRYAPGSRVLVEVRETTEQLRLRVTDEGPAVATDVVPAGGSGGHGLVGMRERVALLGGELRAGPTEQGGFEVAVVLPLSASDTEPTTPAAVLPHGD